MSLEQNATMLADEMSDIYRSLAGGIRAREAGTTPSFPDGIDVPSIAGDLDEPLRLWRTNRKPTRTVPALVAQRHYLDDDIQMLEQLLVGLDVLVTMLDQFIDTSELNKSDKHGLAVNIAFASLLSFASIPAANRTAVVDELLDYLVQSAQIPAVERAVQAELEVTSQPERVMELIQFSYAYRSRDISTFGRLPAVITDLDRRTADRITHDLQTYRAHFLLFDDIRDVREDMKSGDRTPVTWLLRTHDDIDEVLDRLATAFQRFEYTDAPYTDDLTELERRPKDLRAELMSAMRIVNNNSHSDTERVETS